MTGAASICADAWAPQAEIGLPVVGVAALTGGCSAARPLCSVWQVRHPFPTRAVITPLLSHVERDFPCGSRGIAPAAPPG